MNKKWKTYQRLLNDLRPHAGFLLLGIFGTILASGVDAGFTLILRPILDQGFVARNMDFVRWIPAIIFGMFIVRGIAGFISTYFMAWVGRRVVRDFRQRLFTHYLYLPAKFHDQHTSGRLLATIIYNVEQIANAATTIVTFLRELFLIIGLVVVMFINSWRLSLLFLFIAPLVVILIKYSSKRLRRLSHKIQGTMGDVTHIAGEGIEGYRVIRTFGGDQYEINKFNQATENNRYQEMKVAATGGLAFAGIQISIALAISVILYMALSDTADLISAGAFSSLVAAMLAMFKPMKSLSNVNQELQKGLASADSIFQLLDEPLEQDTGTYSVKRVQGRIHYEHVNFSYDENKNILQDVCLTVMPGETVALVGKSGGGKSTLVNLLPRFYELKQEQGKIEIDGVDIREYKLDDLRSQFAYVSQHTVLFNDTIAHNIAYGRQWHAVTEAEIIVAAEAAYAMDFIRELPEGLQTRIGENGFLLSGGQRQRIAIARAILKNAPILILDEATSALDTESEHAIQQALEQLVKNRTTLVIAHRLSTIENADKIIVMDHGRLVEMGTHKQLMATQGYYSKLHALQFREVV